MPTTLDKAVKPFMPTLAAPGTDEKLEVLVQRLRLGQKVWHPFDARWPGDQRTLSYLSRFLESEERRAD